MRLRIIDASIMEATICVEEKVSLTFSVIDNTSSGFELRKTAISSESREPPWVPQVDFNDALRYAYVAVRQARELAQEPSGQRSAESFRIAAFTRFLKDVTGETYPEALGRALKEIGVPDEKRTEVLKEVGSILGDRWARYVRDLPRPVPPNPHYSFERKTILALMASPAGTRYQQKKRRTRVAKDHRQLNLV